MQKAAPFWGLVSSFAGGAASAVGIAAALPQFYGYALEYGLLKPDEKSILKPVDNLFAAWTTRDLSLYMAQWHVEGTQVTRGEKRTKSDIYNIRARQFQRIHSVTVEDYRRCVYFGTDESPAVYSTYTMNVVFNDGRSYREDGVSETYKVVWQPSVRGWVIAENQENQVILDEIAPCTPRSA
jgi:hypothetical protein